MHTSDKGTITELLFAVRLLKSGHSVSRPFGDNQRYDLVLDQDGKFSRIQCKTGRLRDGVVIFNAHSSSKFTNQGKARLYRGEIELFGVYCPDNEKYYLVPVNDVGAKGWLRVEPPKNNQAKGVVLAEYFEI